MVKWSDVTNAVARIENVNGLAVGAGFLIPKDRVITCAHVINIALGRKHETVILPEGSISLVFPRTNVYARGRVIFWDRSADYAILTLEKAVNIQSIKLLNTNTGEIEFWDHGFRAWGFPESIRKRGLFVDGKLRDQLGDGRLQINRKDSTPFIAKGFSGGPIWDEELGGVIGLVVETNERDGLAACLLTKDLFTAIPDLCDAIDLSSNNNSSRHPDSLYKLLDPHNFDLREQIEKFATYYPTEGVIGYVVLDSDEIFLNNFRKRLNDELGRSNTYCHPSTLRVSEIRQPPEIVLSTIRRYVMGRPAEEDIIFFISGLQIDDQIALFWHQLKSEMNELVTSRVLAIVFAIESNPSLPSDIYMIPSPNFTRGDTRIWISGIVNELGWPREAISIWQKTILLGCSNNRGELINLWVYDHLEFASKELRRIRSFAEWKDSLAIWGNSYA